jgi:hypothetical protein
MLPPLEPSPPQCLWSGGRWAFGRYRHPVPDPALPGASRWRTKEWHYHSVVTDQWFLGLAVVQLGYAANAFLYLVDRERPSRRRELEAISPLGRALRFAPSSVRGESSWRRPRERIRLAWADEWQVELDVALGRERLTGELFIGASESLAVCFPLAPDRPAYTHKAAALPARGELRLGSRRIAFDGGLATLDWTRSIARRHTRWKWASFAGRARDGRTVGMNLSADVYDSPEGASHENAAFVEGVTWSLSGVSFELPRDPERDPWQIRSKEGSEVELEFRPLGARKQHLNLGIVRSDFVQPYGTFHGRLAPAGLAPAEVDGVFGVVENHDALW